MQPNRHLKGNNPNPEGVHPIHPVHPVQAPAPTVAPMHGAIPEGLPNAVPMSISSYGPVGMKNQVPPHFMPPYYNSPIHTTAPPPRSITTSAPPPKSDFHRPIFIPYVTGNMNLKVSKPSSVRVKISSEKQGENITIGKPASVSVSVSDEPEKKPIKVEKPKSSFVLSDKKEGVDDSENKAPAPTKTEGEDSTNTQQVKSPTPSSSTLAEPETTAPTTTPAPSSGDYIPPYKRPGAQSSVVNQAEAPKPVPETRPVDVKSHDQVVEKDVAQPSSIPRPSSPQAMTTEGRHLNPQDNESDYSGDGSDDESEYEIDGEDEEAAPSEGKRVFTMEKMMKIRDRVLKNMMERKMRLEQSIKESLKNYNVYIDRPTVAEHPDDKLKKKKQQQERRNGKKPTKTIKMVRGENAWVPGSLAANRSDTEKVRLAMNDILNKITPEKFDRLQKSLLDMKEINNEECVEVLVDCIQEKALLEPKFSDLYARLCNGIVSSETYKYPREFKVSLFNHVEKEFNKELTFHDTNFEASDDKTPMEIEEMKIKERLRALGNINFVGELFNQKILPSKIVHSVINSLLLVEPITPEKIEIGCELLSKIGQVLMKKSEKLTNIYFTILQNIVDDPPKGFNTRIIFLIEGVIELKSNNWVPRIKEEKAKKLSQVLEDHHREEVEKRNEMEKRSQRKGRKGKPQDTDAGWQTTSTKRKTETKSTSSKSTPTATVATKGKFAVFGDSIESPVSPAPSESEYEVETDNEVEEFNEAEAMKRIKYLINSYIEDPSEDPLPEISKAVDISSHGVLVPRAIFDLCTNPKLDTDACCELLHNALKKNLLTAKVIEEAFIQFYEKVLNEQIFLDCALVFKTMASIAPQFIPIDRVHDILSYGQDKYPLAGAKVDDIAFFICEALRQQGENVEETLKKHPKFVSLHCVNTTKKLQMTVLLKQEGIKTFKGDLYDIWALEHVLTNCNFDVDVMEWNARSIACGLIVGVELLGASEEKYKAYKDKLRGVASFSPEIILQELEYVTKRYPDGAARLEKSKQYLINLGILA